MASASLILGMPKLIALSLASAVLLFAQGETTSAVVGSVSDSSGAAIAGATVTISGLETGLKRTAKTDSSGRFDFLQLKPGRYSVKVEAEGFEGQTRDSVSSSLGQKQTANFVLRVAATSGATAQSVP